MYYSTTFASPVGRLTLASDGESLTGLWIEGQKYHGSTIFGDMPEKVGLPVFHAAKSWLKRYFSGERAESSELPLAPAGSDFRKSVWEMLCRIPCGEVTTYGEIAGRTAELSGRKSMSAQAVGGAVGHNPISIIIPCHRVIGTDGSLTGYAGGIEVKLKLLELEGVDISRLYVPRRGAAL